MKEKLDENTPRLSQHRGNHGRSHCALCGGSELMTRWQEHDHNDRPEARCVALCKPCADKVIEKHPRLYRRLSEDEFVPGSSGVCVGCKWQVHLSCTSPKAMFNGGPEPGLEFSPRPSVGHLCRPCRTIAVECEPVTECSGKEGL